MDHFKAIVFGTVVKYGETSRWFQTRSDLTR